MSHLPIYLLLLCLLFFVNCLIDRSCVCRRFDNNIQAGVNPHIDPSLLKELDELHSRGIVSEMNQMDVEDIISPDGENSSCYEIQTPEEIYAQSLRSPENSVAEQEIEAAEDNLANNHIPKESEAIEQINSLLSYLEIDHSPTADSTAQVLKEFAARLRTKIQLQADLCQS